jgi:acetyl esterase/lipase
MLWMAVAEVDVLRREGIAFAEALLNAGVKVTVKEYEKCLTCCFRWTSS